MTWSANAFVRWSSSVKLCELRWLSRSKPTPGSQRETARASRINISFVTHVMVETGGHRSDCWNSDGTCSNALTISKPSGGERGGKSTQFAHCHFHLRSVLIVLFWEWTVCAHVASSQRTDMRSDIFPQTSNQRHLIAPRVTQCKSLAWQRSMWTSDHGRRRLASRRGTHALNVIELLSNGCLQRKWLSTCTRVTRKHGWQRSTDQETCECAMLHDLLESSLTNVFAPSQLMTATAKALTSILRDSDDDNVKSKTHSQLFGIWIAVFWGNFMLQLTLLGSEGGHRTTISDGRFQRPTIREHRHPSHSVREEQTHRPTSFSELSTKWNTFEMSPEVMWRHSRSPSATFGKPSLITFCTKDVTAGLQQYLLPCGLPEWNATFFFFFFSLFFWARETH